LVRSYAAPGTEIDFGAPDDYAGARVVTRIRDQGALPGLHHVISTTAFIRKVVWAEHEGYDAVIQSNTFDPGVEAARLAVSIPVIGLMRTALHHATILSGRLALAVPFESHVAETWRIVRAYGMEHFIQAIRPVGLYPGNMRDEQELQDKLVEVMQGMVRDVRPEMIIPLGGALVPYVIDPKVLEREVGVPVMNTKTVAIRFAETCVQIGLTQSPIAYPKVHLSYEDFQLPAYSDGAS
jgi:allantoin racemase